MRDTLKTFLTLSILIFASGGTLAATQKHKLEPASLYSVRGGLPNVAKKLAAKEDLTLVFLGGSITQGGGKGGYVNQVSEWFRKNYPDSKITAINAGIGGTGSDFGVKRFDRDVLKHNPDLILIEFAVNDGGRNRTKEMERMVHKAWLKNPKTDIIIFYTLHKGHLESYKKGLLPTAASYHERVAKFYKVPTIAPAYYAAKKVNDGEIEWGDFSKDSCHPNGNGYRIFKEAFQKSLPELLKAGQAGAHKLAGSITPNLQVYPPKLKAEPQQIEPFVDKDGKTAAKSYQLPIVGVNWVGTPNFDNDEGKTIWRLCRFNYQRKKGRDYLKMVGSNKAAWDNQPMLWFEGDKSFTGKRGTALAKQSGSDASRLGNHGNELGLIVFVAPETGKYIFRTSAKSVGIWKNDDKSYCLNILLFDWKKTEGQPVAFHEEIKKECKGFTLENELDLMAGEQVAFIALPGPSLPSWMKAGWSGLKIDVGFFE